MAKYVPKVIVGYCAYDKCSVKYRPVYKGNGACAEFSHNKGIAWYHVECYEQLKQERDNAKAN